MLEGRHQNENGTHNGIAALADVTGLTTTSIAALAEGVRANSALLQSCPRHDFSPVAPATAGAAPQKFRCIECGGEVGLTARHWYTLGLAAGAQK